MERYKAGDAANFYCLVFQQFGMNFYGLNGRESVCVLKFDDGCFNQFLAHLTLNNPRKG